MELSKEEKVALSQYRFQKAEEAYADAAANLRQGRYKTAVNRSYYAALHGARALLILQGMDPARHEGVKTLLSLHFVKVGLLPVEAIRSFKYLLTLRTDVDYGDFETLTPQDAEEALRRARQFLDVVDPLRKRLIQELEHP